MNKFISIIIPMYNLETYISDCVQSVLEQTYPYFEVLLIDDGSEDHTWEQCVKMQEQDSRIRIFRQDRKGVSCARNRGLDEACGEYLVFLDGLVASIWSFWMAMICSILHFWKRC